MKKLLAIIILLISNFSFCQLKSVIIDSETKAVIPYVNIWVENENTGTTSNEKGEFSIDITNGKFLILSSLGYEKKRIEISTISERCLVVFLLFVINEANIS
ncbi:carboxypeptidase-like regulatory domain-containing protein [Gaetbulibacter jejuensis]|uniref:carboxypeptidase-like regulatory domain-containing protein n=1 Tax=Gaetbulibacter jejuensis TaxID=584607 RepID=UPI003008A2C3